MSPLTAEAAPKSFEEVFSSLSQVPAQNTLSTDYQNPLYRSLQLSYRRSGGSSSDATEINGAGRTELKLSPLAWGQLGKEQELYQEYTRLFGVLNREGSGQECLYRAHLMTAASHTQSALSLLKKIRQFLEDEMKILRRGIGENLFEFKEMISVQEAQSKNALRISSMEKLSENLEAAINKENKKPVALEDIDFKNFITVKKIKATGLTLEPKKIELEKLKIMAKIHDLELDIEKSESNQILDSIRLYHFEDRISDDIRHGVEITFNVPFFNKRAYIKDAVKRQLAINQLSATQREVLSEIEGTELDFKNKIEQFEALRDSDYYKTLKNLKRALASSKNNSALMIIKTRHKMADHRLRVLDLKHEIIMDHLKKLYMAGELSSCESPSFLVAN
jgi:hypothetical protein